MLLIDLTIGEMSGLALGITDAEERDMQAGRPLLIDLPRPAAFLAVLRGSDEQAMRTALKAASIELAVGNVQELEGER